MIRFLEHCCDVRQHILLDSIIRLPTKSWTRVEIAWFIDMQQSPALRELPSGGGTWRARLGRELRRQLIRRPAACFRVLATYPSLLPPAMPGREGVDERREGFVWRPGMEKCTEAGPIRNPGWHVTDGLGFVGLWVCGCVGLWGCGFVGLWVLSFGFWVDRRRFGEYR